MVDISGSDQKNVIHYAEKQIAMPNQRRFFVESTYRINPARRNGQPHFCITIWTCLRDCASMRNINPA
jgi:hypothetical protein